MRANVIAPSRQNGAREMPVRTGLTKKPAKAALDEETATDALGLRADALCVFYRLILFLEVTRARFFGKR